MLTALRVGFFLGIRQIKKSSKWTTALIIFIMMLTFLNLVGVSGILVGLIEGSVKANREQYSGNVLLTTPKGESYIDGSGSIISILDNTKEVKTYTARFIQSASIEANYRTRRDPDALRDSIGGQVTGIDVLRENEVTNISKYVAEGEYLEPGDDEYVLMGANMIQRYVSAFGEGFDTLDDIFPGTRIRISSNGKTKEYTVKGIVDSKVDQTSFRIFMTEKEFVRFFDRTSLNVNEVAIIANDGISENTLKSILIRNGFDKEAKVQTSEEAIPQFLNDIKLAFGLLGNIIGSIGIVVASITIFIIIFINAITRRKYIGILKAIGIEARSIQFAYIFQSLFYAVAGALLGTIFLYGVMVPGFDAHPIDFPFSDGILVAPFDSTMRKFLLLIIVTFFAGFIPASMIIKKNTLDSILGR
ncbi:MAG: FtsX-like permease family protein [Candidatus Paceibacterota bacterium]